MRGPGVAAISIELGNKDITFTRSGEGGLTKTGAALESTSNQRGTIRQRRDAVAVIESSTSSLRGPGVAAIGIQLGDKDITATRRGEGGVTKTGAALEITSNQRGTIRQRRDALADIG